MKKSNSEKLFLLTNDDGPYSDGLIKLRNCLQKYGRVITVVPHQEMSGSSHALTFTSPLRLKEIEEDVYILNGTPVDCTYVGLFHLMKDKMPDAVISGINCGYNMGEDVLYSGTVGGAMEAFLHNIPAIAVSARNFENIDTVSAHFDSIFEKLLGFPVPFMLNINYPVVDIKGEKITTLSNRMYPGNVEICKDPRGSDTYWIGGVPPVWTSKDNTDIFEVQRGFVSITPLKADLTDYQKVEELNEWLKK